MTSVLGVDGWRGAWVAARVSWSDGEDGEDGDDGEDGEVGKVGKVGKVGDGPARFLGWGAGRFAALLDEDDRVIAVDMPIGLPERGRRRCDVAARDVLRPAGSRVFAVPAHGAWAAEDLGAANRWLRSAGEPGMSAQAFALRAAIAEVAEHASDPRLVEVHPELAFVELSGEVLPAKKTAQGVARRIRALDGWVDVLGALASAPPRVPIDDALDALAAAWTAARVAAGTSRTFPADGGDLDGAGRRMCIYA